MRLHPVLATTVAFVLLLFATVMTFAANNYPIDTYGGTRTVLCSTEVGGVHTPCVGIVSGGNGAAFTSSVTITRTADTNAYLANDVVGAATGSSAGVEFQSIGPVGGGEIVITSARLEIQANALIAGETSYNLYCYSATPPSALGDNAAFDIPAGDRASYLGKISLGTPIDEGSTLSVDIDGINKQLTVTASRSIFCYLVTVGAYTPTSARVYRIVLHAMGL